MKEINIIETKDEPLRIYEIPKKDVKYFAGLSGTRILENGKVMEGSICIIRKDNNTPVIVSSYSENFKDINEFYENCFYLIQTFNAKVIMEFDVRARDIFESKNMLDNLVDAKSIYKQINPTSVINNDFGLYPSVKIKDTVNKIFKNYPEDSKTTSFSYGLSLLAAGLRYNEKEDLSIVSNTLEEFSFNNFEKIKQTNRYILLEGSTSFIDSFKKRYHHEYRSIYLENGQSFAINEAFINYTGYVRLVKNDTLPEPRISVLKK